jgi:4-methyl-5(b-hydroxyethyl)-thiazole monophosphate biosynthesis
MAKALVVLANGFEETEAVAIIDVLRRAGVAVTAAGLSDGPVRGSHDIVVQTDAPLSAVQDQPFDALVLPGGMPGARHLAEDARVLELVRSFVAAKKLTAAICAAPIVLEAAGVLSGVRATAYPGHKIPSASYVEEPVVEDGPIVTSRGVGTVLEFALTLVRRLVSPEARDEHARRLLTR